MNKRKRKKALKKRPGLFAISQIKFAEWKLNGKLPPITKQQIECGLKFIKTGWIKT